MYALTVSLHLNRERERRVVTYNVTQITLPVLLDVALKLQLVGTAAEVSAVNSVDDRPVPCPGPATKVLADAYADLVRGRNETYRAWNELAS